MNWWTLCFPGFTRLGLTDGSFAILVAHLPQMRGVI